MIALIMAGLALITVVVVATTYDSLFLSSHKELAIVERETLDRLERIIKEKYEKDAALLEANPTTAQTIFGVTGLTTLAKEQGYNIPFALLRTAVSNPQTSGAVQYLNIYVWLPHHVSDSSHYDPSTDTMYANTGVMWRRVSGLPIEQARYEASNALLQAWARSFELRARAKWEADPLRDVTRNYFIDSFVVGAESIGSIPTYTALNALPHVTGLLGAGNVPTSNAWGSDVEISNGQDASLVAPFTMALRTRTPWGTYIGARAVQQTN
ncbi:MAG: hypothetical protein F9K47_11290 [Burkholderiales bacterium]|nr:MAG: hypothetical protein F9K47_11290 [Burkholderiales bacterium]